MDPNAALQELLQLARVEAEKGERWAELVLGLHEWIMRGGFLPSPWAASRSDVDWAKPKKR